MFQVYEGELEDAFDNFTDLAQTFELYRGKGARDPDDPEGNHVGILKVSMKSCYIELQLTTSPSYC